MKEILLTSSVLILALLALRRLFRRTISRRMQYVLWALVLVRLLVPLNVGTLAHNVLSAAEPVQAAVEKRLETPILYMQDGTERRPAQLANGNAPQGEPQSPPADAAQSAPADEYSLVTPTYRAVALSEALTYVWYAGMLIVGAWFLFTNLRFARALRKARTPYSVEGCRYPVYLVSALPSPCLFGVLRPAIYLNNAATASPETLRFVLAHEQTHARQLPAVVSAARSVSDRLLVRPARVARSGALARGRRACLRRGDAPHARRGRAHRLRKSPALARARVRQAAEPTARRDDYDRR